MDINLPAAANRASVSYYILRTILATLHMWQQRYGVSLSLKILPYLFAFRTLSSSRLRITLTFLRLAMCLFCSSEWKAEEEEDIVELEGREEKSGISPFHEADYD
jgi:hypothetical protein